MIALLTRHGISLKFAVFGRRWDQNLIWPVGSLRQVVSLTSALINRPTSLAPGDNSGGKLQFCAMNEELLMCGSALRLVSGGNDLDHGQPVISGGQ
jgi:hypothetical protein